MPLVATRLLNTVFGDKRVVVGTLAFDSSYPTGGESLSLSQVGLNKLDAIFIENTYGYAFSYNYANNKVLVYHCDYDATGDGPLIQVPNETDLSSLTAVRFIAFGT